MKYLIVNADDFGASCGINRGIMEAHERGILTSASLLVDAQGAKQAAALSRTAPNLSVGLHADVRMELEEPADDAESLAESLRRQFRRFEQLMRCRPTHIDSHHNVHRDPRALPHFLEFAREYGMPLREHSRARYFSKFYGQWGGKTHLEQISVESLARMLQTEIGDSVTELSCHPGHVDAEYPTGYSLEREAELRTLCDPRVRDALAEHAFQLISYHHLPRLLINSTTSCGNPSPTVPPATSDVLP
ncbi:MAG TPA: ChbG/HpnK family deacetylase [Candidatus Acidoferrum sp.]|jgi:predicted glycoside hydrolase/deacetylase ChbG (UPF0249 family)|nr:ChbG/HpnK family deacetylase [Candidatus Acidoferrum sp.]